MKLDTAPPDLVVAAWRRAAADAGDRLISIPTDINELGEYAPQWLIVTAKGLWVFDETALDGPRVAVEIDELEDVRSVSVVGSGLLQVKVDGLWVHLMRYSNRLKYTFGRVARRIDQLRKGERIELNEDDEHDPRRCRGCGLLLQFPGETCPRCVSSGAALTRVMQLMKPYWHQAVLMLALLLGGIALDMVAPLLTRFLVDDVLRAAHPAAVDQEAVVGREVFERHAQSAPGRAVAPAPRRRRPGQDAAGRGRAGRGAATDPGVDQRLERPAGQPRRHVDHLRRSGPARGTPREAESELLRQATDRLAGRPGRLRHRGRPGLHQPTDRRFRYADAHGLLFGADDVQPRGAHAADARAADAACGDRFQQHDEPAVVPGDRRNRALEHDLVLEAFQAVGRREDGAVDAEDVEPAPVGTAVVPDQNDPALAESGPGRLALVELTVLKVPGGVDEGIKRRGRDDQQIAGLDLFQYITH